METQIAENHAKNITQNQRYTMRSAQRAYTIAKAFHETNLAIDQESKQDELNAFDYPIADEWKDERKGVVNGMIKDPKIDYLMKDNFCDEYYHAVYNRRIAKGWNVKYQIKDAPQYVVTADADSFPILKMAEDVLIDCVLDTVHQSMRKDLERARHLYNHRQELIDLAMKWDTKK